MRALPAQGTAPAQTLEQADKLYEEKSYAGALEAYERLLKAGKVPAPREDEVAYRIAVSLGKAQKWDRALDQSLQFVKEHQKTAWEPRGLYWMGRLYVGVPHEGWRVGGKVRRGGDVPQGEGVEAPERVFLHQQDTQNATDALEAARVYYPQYRKERSTEEEEILLNFDLSRLLQHSPEFHVWGSAQKWAPPEDPGWKVDPAAPYSPEWAPPKKLMYLFEQIRTLAAEGEARSSQQVAKALLAKALWLQQYHAQMQQYAVKWENGKQIRIPYPYQDVSAEATLRRLLTEHPDDPIRDQAHFLLGSMLNAGGKFTAAVAEFRKLVQERPQSKWAEDARFQLQQTTRRELAVNLPGTFLPGKPVQAHVYSRNVKQVHFEVFKLKLEEVLGRPATLNDPQTTFTHFSQNFGKLGDAAKYYGPMVAKWDWKTEDAGDYVPKSGQAPLPVKEIGAYVVEASAPGLRTATVVTITDLVAVQKLTRDEGLFFVTHGLTGEPVAGADVIAKQWWHSPGGPHSASTRGKTNGEGIFIYPLQRGPERNGFGVAALAFKSSRYATTEQIQTWGGDDNPELYKVYSIADRAVFRPGQRVHYRHIVQRRMGGELKPAASQHLQVRVRDPRGEIIHEKSESANEFGSISGELVLSAGAPLGEYAFEVTIPNVNVGVDYNGANRFRVEEYKKPEFEVGVKPVAERVCLGEPTSARITASYYFGGPVPKAKVTYRVYRTYYAQQYRFPRPFDFLYHHWNNGDYNTGYRNGEVVKQGETRTDDKGEAEISFPTDAPANTPHGNFSYTIEADVQDASRRVISGTGSVKATRHDVAVFVDFQRGYATKGEVVDAEIVTLNPSDEPVSVAGTAKVYRYPETPVGKETLVHEQALKTDKQGRAFLKWTAETAGRFRVEFETRDTAGLLVKGGTEVWVAGPELERGRFLHRDVMLRVQNPYYEEGQTASVLLVTPEPGCTVLLTREANNEILERRVLRVQGQSMELKLPLAKRDVPNVYLSAVMIRDGNMFQTTQEVFVPPVRQFAKVTVEADRERYQPGEKARLRLAARDWQGRPLRTELSVAITDASLAYIQKDYAPDIRLYYYGNRRSLSVPGNGSLGVGFQPG
ncbi:MAG TPA: MG2 domain-containing protein, partial [Armatimonadota bacterium]|nr:MG2 domain-containing protein [Armatimonadota bacterium]